MISRIVAIGSLAALLAAASPATADDTFKALLSGDQEVPPVTDQGTTGKFEIQFNRDFTEGDYTLRVDSGVRVTQAHLHCAPAGVNGTIIIFLAGFQAKGWDVDGKWISNATVTNANIVDNTTACGKTLAEIAHAAANGNVYANVHSVAKPAGVARGQLEGL
jgi:hypothetical protein